MSGRKRRRVEDEDGSIRDSARAQTSLETSPHTSPPLSSFSTTPIFTISSATDDENDCHDGRIESDDNAKAGYTEVHGEWHGESEMKGLPSPSSISAHSDDDNSREADICYGMIHHVKCRRLELSNSPKDHNIGQEYITLLLVNDNGTYTATLKTGKVLGLLNCKIALALDSLSATQASCMAYVRLSDLLDPQTGPIKRTKKSSVFQININVYGCAEEGLKIGCLLSKHDLFLQDPLWQDRALAYNNPQMLFFPEMTQDDVWMHSIGVNAEEWDWSQALDDLPEHQTEMDVFECNIITVPLLSHQTRGRDFMLCRETGKLGGSCKLWRLEPGTDGTPIHRHVVTGNEVLESPPEPCGGILADDMGLGKTLTSIAVIAASIDRARRFVASPTSHFRGLSRSRAKASLVVVPSTLILDSWAEEIESRTRPGSLKVRKYHGHDRVHNFSELLDCDLVLTTYGTITTEFRKRTSRNVLYHVCWFRIILDEAHTIRSQHTRQFKAITSLDAQHRWCLTGTPIANRIDDLGALLQFCRIPELEDPALFRKHVTKPSKLSFALGCRVLRSALPPVCLRRTKSLLNLPKPNYIHSQVDFSPSEAHAYRQTVLTTKSEIDAFVSGKAPGKKRTTVLQAILRLRRLCNHGTLLPLENNCLEDERLDPDEAWTFLQELGAVTCGVCGNDVALIHQLEDPNSGTVADCGHVRCRSCLPNHLAAPGTQSLECQACEENVQQGSSSSAAVCADLPKIDELHSSKLNKLVGNLFETKGIEKSLVFSVWKKTIDLASQLCKLQSIPHVCIDGTTPEPQRKEALEKFKNDPGTSALLMTFGTGALGLTLTSATRIHIIEPQWNPTVEEQAIGRAVRIGQENKTTVIRYTVKDTVEEQIQGYQKRKIQLAAGGFGEGSEAETEAETKLLTASFLNQTL